MASGERADSANDAVGVDTLYGALVFMRIWTSAGWANAIPNLFQVTSQHARDCRRVRQHVPDGSEAEALAQRLCHTKVCVFLDQRDRARLLVREVDVRLVNNDDALEILVLEDFPYRRQRDEGARGVPR